MAKEIIDYRLVCPALQLLDNNRLTPDERYSIEIDDQKLASCKAVCPIGTEMLERTGLPTANLDLLHLGLKSTVDILDKKGLVEAFRCEDEDDYEEDEVFGSPILNCPGCPLLPIGFSRVLSSFPSETSDLAANQPETDAELLDKVHGAIKLTHIGAPMDFLIFAKRYNLSDVVRAVYRAVDGRFDESQVMPELEKWVKAAIWARYENDPYQLDRNLTAVTWSTEAAYYLGNKIGRFGATARLSNLAEWQKRLEE